MVNILKKLILSHGFMFLKDKKCIINIINLINLKKLIIKVSNSHNKKVL